MKCPVCKTTDLLMTERRSIEIDYCPDCRGVWLDRGELDKLIAQDAGSPEVRPLPHVRARMRHRDRDPFVRHVTAATTIIERIIADTKRSARSSTCSISTEHVASHPKDFLLPWSTYPRW